MNYTPDSAYTLFINDPELICKNTMNIDGIRAEAPQREKIFCPFGIHLNTSIYKDHNFLESYLQLNNRNTTWGRVPQLDPRPLSRIGMEFRNN
jgi:hypothetical protein